MILIINGPNINMLGKRNVNIYGSMTYSEMCKKIEDYAASQNQKIIIFQSNSEGEIISRIQCNDYDSLIINAGAYSHYSYAIRDALEIFDGIKIEVHISNIFSRDEFRKTSVISPVCTGVISGLGTESYLTALNYIKIKEDL